LKHGLHWQTGEISSPVWESDRVASAGNAWKKLINRGDVFEFVVDSIVWNDELWII
jgi:hypothetical protein